MRLFDKMKNGAVKLFGKVQGSTPKILGKVSGIVNQAQTLGQKVVNDDYVQKLANNNKTFNQVKNGLNNNVASNAVNRLQDNTNNILERVKNIGNDIDQNVTKFV